MARGWMKNTLAAAICAGGLAACANDPGLTDTVDARPTPDGMKTVAVCYNASNTTRDAVAEIASNACPEETSRLQVWDHDSLLNACPLTKKNRVVFLCVK